MFCLSASFFFFFSPSVISHKSFYLSFFHPVRSVPYIQPYFWNFLFSNFLSYPLFKLSTNFIFPIIYNFLVCILNVRIDITLLSSIIFLSCKIFEHFAFQVDPLIEFIQPGSTPFKDNHFGAKTSRSTFLVEKQLHLPPKTGSGFPNLDWLIFCTI
jgi:hypothetical protein